VGSCILYYGGHRHDTGLPLASILFVVFNIAFIWVMMLVEPGLYARPRYAPGSRGRKILQTAGGLIHVFGVSVPFALAAFWPVPVLLGIQKPVGILIMFAPLAAMAAWIMAMRRNARRHRDSDG
jgi:hypothetical protein